MQRPTTVRARVAALRQPVPERNRYTWFIAWSPVLQVLVHWALLALGVPLAWLHIGLVAILWVPLALVAAILDAESLRTAGARSSASPWLVMLTPLPYLIARGRALRDQTFNPWAPIGGHGVAVAVAVLLAGFTYVTAAFGLQTGTLGY